MGSYLNHTPRSFYLGLSLSLTSHICKLLSEEEDVAPVTLFLHMRPGEQGRRSPHLLPWAMAAVFYPLRWCLSSPFLLLSIFLPLHTLLSPQAAEGNDCNQVGFSFSFSFFLHFLFSTPITSQLSLTITKGQRGVRMFCIVTSIRTNKYFLASQGDRKVPDFGIV